MVYLELPGTGQDRIWPGSAARRRRSSGCSSSISASEQLRDRILALTPDTWQASAAAEIGQGVDRLHELAQERERHLNIYPS